MSTTIDKLKSNPVFNMSLHSKELFHSNFWAWLFEHNVEYAKIFFPDLKKCDSVEREQGHRDITIWSEKKAYIIENKFKSIPGLKQIKDYQSEVGDKFAKGVLTGIVYPDFMKNESDWIFITYREIAVKIKDVADKVEAEAFEKELISRYSEMLLDLNEVIVETLKNSSNNWVTSIDFLEISKIRMDDIVKKLVASNYVSYMNKVGLDELLDNNKNGYDLVIESGYSHKHAILDVRYVQKDNSDILSVIGIQVEDNEYRWCIQIDKELDEEQRQKLFEKYVGLGWFETYDKANKVIKGRKTGMIKPFGTYSTKKYTFLYQYWKLEDSSFEAIRKQIVEDMKLAAKLI